MRGPRRRTFGGLGIAHRRTGRPERLTGLVLFSSFDSPSVFASILDWRKGRSFVFSISPVDDAVNRKQLYWPDSNVLLTRFLSADGVAEVLDYMPVGVLREGTKQYHGVIRRVRVVRGSMKLRMECYPAFNYARDPHETRLVEGGAKFFSKDLNMALASDIGLETNHRGVNAEFTLEAGQSASFEFHGLLDRNEEQIGLSDRETDELFHDTVEYWRRWISRSNYKGRWREMVNRSALTLKLLTSSDRRNRRGADIQPAGEIGGARNWDYRYTWIRDAAFTLYGLLRLGYTEEATAFMSFIDAALP